MRRRKYHGRHVVLERRNRKPLTRRNVLLRLREIYELLDPKYETQLTADDMEIIDYNFALAQMFDQLHAKGEVQAIGFEADLSGNEPEEDEEDDGEEYVQEIINKKERKKS